MAVQLAKFSSLLALLGLALPLFAHAAAINTPPNNLGLVGYWSFDEGSGTAVADHSGNGNSGTLMGSPTFGSGKFGKALTLNGSTDYVAMATGTTLSFPNQTFTVSFWEKESTSVNWIMANQAIGGGWGIQASGVVFLKDGVNSQSQYTPTASTQTTLRDGKWHHVLYVITTNTSVASSQNVTMYVDNVLDGGSLNKATVYAAVNRFMIGTRSDNNGQNGALWAGSVDDIRIYSRGLSTTEISSLYQEKAANIKMPNANGLVGYWNFNEGGGTTANDASGQGHTATLAGGTWVSGKLGTALSFNGTSDKVSGGSFTVGTNMTISAWVYKNTSTLQRSFFSNRGTNGRVYFGLVGTQIFLFDNGGTPTSFKSNSGVVSIGKWQHIVVTSDGSTSIFYLNGVFATSTPQTRTASTGASFGIGWDPNLGTEFWDGKIDELRVYNRTLSAAEVAALYQAQSTTVGAAQSLGTLSSGLVGWWTFDGKDISTNGFVDRSGNGFNGYLIGTNNATTSRETIGKIGQGYSFAGQNTGAINLGTSNSLTPSTFTIAGWVYFTSSSYCYNYIYSNARDVSATNGIDFKVYCSGSLSGLIANGGTRIALSTSISANVGTWTHVAFVADGTTMRLYVNGVQKATGSQTISPGAPADNATCIGSMGNSACSSFTLNGKLDDIRLYNRALSAGEIQHLYSMGK